ncbi:MAG: DUF4272 domain-containing protein [Lachnospiraceae bacterium]|nr:DUF4272 domain-containing protein [Lachnospiraceae bacterium]
MGLFDRFKKEKEKTGTDTPAFVEKKLYILCMEKNSNTMLKAFDSVFGTLLADSGVNNGTLRNGELSVQVVTYGQDLGDECKEFIQKQANSVCGYTASLETAHTDIKINVIHQLLRSKGFIFLKCSYPGPEDSVTEDMLLQPLYAVTSKVHGLLLTDEATTIINEDGKVVLDQSGNSQLEWFMPCEQPLPADFFNGAPASSLRRRDESLKLLRDRHIHVTEWLPLIESEEDAHFRTTEEIAGRAAALLIVALYSECLLGDKKTISEAREFVKPIIRSFHAEMYFSPKEKDYLENDDSSENEQIQFAWQYEPLMVMLWALGYEKELFFPDHICDVPGVVRTMHEHQTVEALVQDAAPRSQAELLQEADLIYRMDWACVGTRIHGLPAPAGMNGGVVMERHKALNWLICGEDWDHVDIST